MTLQFIKMDGLGNDFVILDSRGVTIDLSEEKIQAIASRDNEETGGCDQIIVMNNSDIADVGMLIFNSDGGSVDACGNASRCVAMLVAKECGRNDVTIATNERILRAEIIGEHMVMINMGEPGLDWQQIPLLQEIDTIDLGIGEGVLQNPVGVSMGNPHAVFFVDDIDDIDLHNVGPLLEHNDIFPQRANIGVGQIIDRQNLRLRVWERGVGETQACGTGACAALVAAVRREITEREVTVALTGGDLQIGWDKNSNHVMMTGEVSPPVRGEINF